MKVKYLFLLLTILFSLTGCQKAKEDVITVTDAIPVSTPKVLVTAEEFMQNYSLTEDQIPTDYVQAFIDDYQITADDLNHSYAKDIVLNHYTNGDVFGYNINRIFQGTESTESLSDYMQQAKVIMFHFDMHYGSELAYTEIMVIDLGKGNIYYTRQYEEDYVFFEMSAALSDEDITAIRSKLPEHISEEQGVGDYGGYGDYSFLIKMLADDGTVKFYDGNQGDEIHFPGFDDYWMNLYKQYFGEEFQFSFPE